MTKTDTATHDSEDREAQWATQVIAADKGDAASAEWVLICAAACLLSGKPIPNAVRHHIADVLANAINTPYAPVVLFPEAPRAASGPGRHRQHPPRPIPARKLGATIIKLHLERAARYRLDNRPPGSLYHDLAKEEGFTDPEEIKRRAEVLYKRAQRDRKRWLDELANQTDDPLLFRAEREEVKTSKPETPDK